MARKTTNRFDEASSAKSHEHESATNKSRITRVPAKNASKRKANSDADRHVTVASIGSKHVPDEVPFDATEDYDDDATATAVDTVPNRSNDSDNSDGLEAQLSDETEAVAERFVGRWNRLISQTNWEKGAIISQWRAALVDTGATSNAYGDEAWVRRVEGVTSQHVGRLRRVHDRFARTQSTFDGLYWTHFLAALDWEDAELWLEGASQSHWSVSQMRKTRWQALGGDPKSDPKDHELVTAESEEGKFAAVDKPDPTNAEDDDANDRFASDGPFVEGPDFGDDEERGDPVANSDTNRSDESDIDFDAPATPAALIAPFSALPTLPVDIAECLEQFKLSIVRHRSAGWQDISPNDVCKVLDALRGFALAGIA